MAWRKVSEWKCSEGLPGTSVEPTVVRWGHDIVSFDCLTFFLGNVNQSHAKLLWNTCRRWCKWWRQKRQKELGNITMTYKTATNKQGTQNDIKGIHKRMATDTSKDMQSDFPITTQGIKKCCCVYKLLQAKWVKWPQTENTQRHKNWWEHKTQQTHKMTSQTKLLKGANDHKQK